jgi:type III restriction enzyme
VSPDRTTSDRIVKAIAQRLSLRKPQRESLELLARVCELSPPKRGTDTDEALAAVQLDHPQVKGFDRAFPSLCFALATGVGKTRLMGAFIAFLHEAYGVNNFFVLAPNLTIYAKLINDFRANTPKYVLKGIERFAVNPPEVITGDNYESRGALLNDVLRVKINIFNVSKITSEVRGGKQMRMRSFKEELGQSYFDYLAGQKDLVLLMDESHRYRATAGFNAINELRPVLGLELTATPFVETPKGPVPFGNVIYDYPLARALEDGFVKDPAVVTRANFTAAGKGSDVIQRMKLEDGIRLHEKVKVELATYARQTGEKQVKPFVLVIARDTTHAAELQAEMSAPHFFEGRYAGKVLKVDSSEKEEETVASLLTVESADNPVEIVIHVNMLKEGWDVTNLYTIIPLRAANARTLIEQSIGRGLRLPYGKRTGVASVDRLNIVAHDRFQEIVEEANRPDSPVRMQKIILDDPVPGEKPRTVVSASNVDIALGLAEAAPAVTGPAPAGSPPAPPPPPLFANPQEQQVAQLAYAAIKAIARRPDIAPDVRYVASEPVQAQIVREVARQFVMPPQLELDGIVQPAVDIAAVVAKTAALMVEQVISIPRIVVLPKGEVKAWFKPFTLDTRELRYPAPDETLYLRYLDRNEAESIGLAQGGIFEQRPEDYVVSGLIDFPDVAYEENADLLYDLAGQVVAHLGSYLAEPDVVRVLQLNQREIAAFVHAQMLAHYEVDEGVEFETRVSQGFVPITASAHTAETGEILDFRAAPADKSNMGKYLFGGFQRCLKPTVRFDSDSERKLAVVLERDAQRWFRPARGQFYIFYRDGADQREYVPDFVAETATELLLIEPKMANQMKDAAVLAKRDAALAWCKAASEHAIAHSGKPWRYLLIPHDVIADNMTLYFLSRQYGET